MTNPLPVNYLLDEYKDTTSEEVARLYAEVVDRWTWDTGSEEDAKLMQRIGTEHRWREGNRKERDDPKPVSDNDVGKIFARELANEIDREILRDLINMADEKET